ncbi:ABC transporter substrate-binding protein [Alkalicoccobacillus murimartini]|uniref:Peptide/nickel transport system substrate-binding protein n=1 Tax=Alkalicoccobacillus murimartini TaxID=171685 RepID=A0ABT9YMT7_9BACI|nr:ABC transporter substrate-binding protein [Alkalicoccobacillus murimartini]MDQ0209165.1 peptide/nickel transport system substrate-binding protein [Alkalicoccobacillus murimartini]
MNWTKLSVPVLSSLLVLTACGGIEDPDSPSTSSDDSEENNVLTIANPADITTLDPQNNSVITTSAVLVNIYNKLVKRDESGEIIADLATDWEPIDDQTWEFNLQPDVTFQNGDAFTAEDVKFSLERVAKDDSLQQYSTFNIIDSVEVIDDSTVRIHTNEPDPQLLSRLAIAGASILPAAYFEEVGSDEFFQDPVGTGPYELNNWNRDEQVELVKFEDYFEGEPNWDTVHFNVVPEDSTRVSELLTDGTDIAFNIPTADFDRIDDNDGTHVAVEPIQRVIQLWLSTEDGAATADPAVREAIDLAINNQVIIDEILNGAGTATRTQISPGNFGADESLYDTFEYDQERARELLAEAGYEDGVTVEISVNNYYTEMAQVMEGMLADVGITADIELVEQSQFAERLFNEELREGVFVGWGNDMFDGSTLELFRESNVTSYDNPEVDSLLDAAATNMNEEERAEQFKEIQQILAEDRGVVYLFQLQGRYGVSDRIDYTPRLDELYYVDDITLN